MAGNKSQQIVCSRVAQSLHDKREELGLSMNVVAQRAGLSQQMVSYVERGMRNPTLDTLLRICDAMDIKLSPLIQEAEKFAVKGKR